MQEIELEGRNSKKGSAGEKAEKSCTIHVPALFLLRHFKGNEREERERTEQTKAKILQFLQRIKELKFKK